MVRSTSSDVGAVLVEVLGGRTQVVDHAPDAERESTYPTEVVTAVVNGTIRRIFCKHDGGVAYESHGHRSGVLYEALVYRDVLSRLTSTTAAYYGHHVDPTTGA